MLNNVILIGHIAREPALEETTTGKKVTTITLAIPRSFKNVQGVYETDFVLCRLWEALAKNVVTNCKKGSLIAIKGRLQTRHFENDESKRVYVTEVIAERVNFLK